jgi:hypothetical protein
VPLVWWQQPKVEAGCDAAPQVPQIGAMFGASVTGNHQSFYDLLLTWGVYWLSRGQSVAPQRATEYFAPRQGLNKA